VHSISDINLLASCHHYVYKIIHT